MNNKPSFDRGLLIPIGVAIFSLVGICVLLVGGRIINMRGSVEEVPTATSFQYALVGTEPAIVTVTGEATNVELVTLPPRPVVTLRPRNTPLNLSTNTLAPLSTASLSSASLDAGTPTRTPTSASTTSLGAGKFDDGDTHMVYSGNWNGQAGVSGAYQGTLHVSSKSGNSVSFRFTGQDLSVFFQAGPGMGLMQLKLDGKEYEMNEYSASTQIYQWVLPSVNNGTHEVTITHMSSDSANSGVSINIDYIMIAEATATPSQ